MGADFEDFSEIEFSKIGLSGEFAFTSKINSNKAVYQNLGIYKNRDGKYYTGRYAGITWLRNKEGQIVKNNHNEKVILHIKPRFGLIIDDMIQKIAEDEEFFDYLCNDQPDGEKLFTFFLNEEMLEVKKDEAGKNLIMVVMTYVHALYQETRRCLMKKIVRKEENFTGKVKGKIIFNKQISKNLARGHAEKVYCGYVDKSEDIFENQVLKVALKKAYDFLSSKNKKIENAQINREIKACQLRLSKVSDLESLEPEDIDKIELPAMYSNYDFLLKLAKILIASFSMTSELEIDSNKIIPYAVNMPLLFECYARTLIKEKIKETEYRMLKFVSDKSKANDDEYGIRTIDRGYYISGKVVPDIVLVNGKNEYIILDAKYKNVFWESDGKKYIRQNYLESRNDRLQLLAYNQIYQPKLCGHVFPRFLVKEEHKNFLLDLCMQEIESSKILYMMLFCNCNDKTLKGKLEKL